MTITRTDLENAVDLDPFDDTSARDRMGLTPRRTWPEISYRDGAVLMLHYPTDEGTSIVLTRRTDTVEHHRRQISLPGGAREDGEDLITTALRETEEEVGVSRETVEVLGRLPVFHIPVSRFEVTPVVAWIGVRPAFTPDPREVESIIEVPLARLLDPSARREEDREIRGSRYRTPFFAIDGITHPPLWGATAMMLAGFLGRLEAVL